MAGIVDTIKDAVVGKITDYDANRPGVTEREGYTLFAAVGRSLFELTLWSKLLRGDELRKATDDPETVETTHGLARIAASYGRDNNLKGLDIQVKLDRVLKNQDEILRTNRQILELLEGRK